MPADSPECFVPCDSNPSIPADSPDCDPPPCRYNPTIPASDPACPPPCQYDPSIPASEPNCTPCIDPANTDPACVDTTTSIVVPTTQPPTTLPPTTVGPSTTFVPTVTEVISAESNVAAVDATDPTAAQLPSTGTGSLVMALIALGLVAAGTSMIAATRRRRPA